MTQEEDQEMLGEENNEQRLLQQVPTRQRHDQGPRLTARDLTCLHWIAQQYAIRLDQLQQLLRRHTPTQYRDKLNAGTTLLSLERTYDTLERWRTLQLIEQDAILHGDQVWTWLSRVGLRDLGMPFYYGKGKPASVRLPHLYYINQVRLAIEERRPQDVWQSERQLRHDRGPLVKGVRQAHLPDAILAAANGKVTAIEVERRLKNETELEDTLRTLAVEYTSVWYFASVVTKKKIEALLETFPPQMRKPFVLYRLGDYGHAYDVS